MGSLLFPARRRPWWRIARWVVAAPALFLGLWACNGHPLVSPLPAPVQQTDQYIGLDQNRDIDILFVIDDSPSMADKQNNLIKNFPVFMEQLKNIKGGLPNVHIGVVSSDLGAGPTGITGGCERVGGDRGILQVKPGCALQGGSRFIVSSEAGRVNNFAGDISEIFTCMASLGDRGCGFEHSLQALRVALWESVAPQNAGFLRPDAYLGIIILTDEDDCSALVESDLFSDKVSFPGTTTSLRCAQAGHLCGGVSPPVGPFDVPLASCTSNENGRLLPVGQIVASVKAVKSRPDEQIIVAAITGGAGDTAGARYRYGVPDVNQGEGLDYLPFCQGANGKATAAIRVRQFVESFGGNGSLHSICEDDFSPAMAQIGAKLAAVVDNLCVDGPLADTRAEPGLQPDCVISDRFTSSSGATVEQALPLCAGGKVPCWKLTPDSHCGGSGYKLEVERGTTVPAPRTEQVVKCLTCARPDDPRCQQ